MVGWLFFVVVAASCASLAWWATRPGAQAKRAGAVLVAAGALIVGLGFYWLPPVGTLIALNDARRASVAMPAELDCAQAARAVEVAERMSSGLFKFNEEGDLALPRFVWERISESERLALGQLAGTAARCKEGGAGSAEIVDSETGEILFRTEEAIR